VPPTNSRGADDSSQWDELLRDVWRRTRRPGANSLLIARRGDLTRTARLTRKSAGARRGALPRPSRPQVLGMFADSFASYLRRTESVPLAA
jgi:hypothetical protein